MESFELNLTLKLYLNVFFVLILSFDVIKYISNAIVIIISPTISK